MLARHPPGGRQRGRQKQTQENRGNKTQQPWGEAVVRPQPLADMVVGRPNPPVLPQNLPQETRNHSRVRAVVRPLLRRSSRRSSYLPDPSLRLETKRAFTTAPVCPVRPRGRSSYPLRTWAPPQSGQAPLRCMAEGSRTLHGQREKTHASLEKGPPQPSSCGRSS